MVCMDGGYDTTYAVFSRGFLHGVYNYEVIVGGWTKQ